MSASKKLVRIPWVFYLDHHERALPTPESVKETKRHLWIRLDDPATSELLDDAKYYSSVGIGTYGMDREYTGLVASARATARAIEAAAAPEALT